MSLVQFQTSTTHSILESRPKTQTMLPHLCTLAASSTAVALASITFLTLLTPALLAQSVASLVNKVRGIHDYNNPKELRQITEKAESQSMEQLVREHGLKNLKKYQIVSEDRLFEYETQRSDRLIQKSPLRENFKVRTATLLHELRSIEWKIKHRTHDEYQLARNELYAQNGLSPSEQFGFSDPHWMRRELSEKSKQIQQRAFADLEQVHALRKEVKKHTGYKELQRSYEKEMREWKRVHAPKITFSSLFEADPNSAVLTDDLHYFTIDERIALVRSLIQLPN